MYDIHCHITFDVDDGSQSIDESVRMAELAYETGTKGIVATPHSNVPNSYKNYWSNELLNKVKQIREELKKNHIRTKIFCGQEIFCTSETVRLLKSGDLITLNNTKYPLVEFGTYEKTNNVYTNIRRLFEAGYTPIIAHPERYAFVSENFDFVEKLKKMGCILQVNKGSVMGSFGSSTMECAERLLEARMADIIASDAHSPYMRTTEMLEVHEYICENYSYDYADLLLNVNPGMVLQNLEIYKY